MSQIVMVLLTNGEEVFGELLGENDKGIDLNNALVVQYTMSTGQPTILFRKYCTYSNNFDVFFKREHIVAVFKDLREEVIKSYSMTMELYDNNEFPAFENSDEIIEFEPENDEVDEGWDDSFYYKNKTRKVH